MLCRKSDFNFLYQTEAALVVALEASRNEASALKIAYNYANDKYNEIKSAYDKLIVQLKEEVSDRILEECHRSKPLIGIDARETR